MKDVFIARDKECAALRDCLQSERSEFVIIYGRRGIGKTYLIDRFFNGTYDFTFVGAHRATQKVQLRNFAKALKKHTKAKSAPTFDNWYDAFDALEEYLEVQPTERKKVVFIDEMPWIDTQKSEFVDALENFWNGWANRLTDLYTLFYYKFIESDTSEDPQWWNNNLDSRSVTSWMGLCFELVCLMHKQQIKRALGLAVVSTSIAAWRQPRKEGEHKSIVHSEVTMADLFKD